MMRIARRWMRGLAVVTALVIGCSQLGRLHYLFDALSNFQVQYLMVSCILTLCLLALKCWRYASICACAVALTGWHVVPWYLPRAETNSVGQPLRVMLFNVYQFNNRHTDVLATIQKVDAGLIVVQEADENWYAMLQPLLASHQNALHVPGGVARGMAVFSRYPIEDLRSEDFKNFESRSIAGTVVVNDHRLSLMTTHPWPPIREDMFEHRNEQLALTAVACAKLARPAILLGDLNTAMWSPFYRDFERVSGLRNARHGFGIIPTHSMHHHALLRIPIDHILISDDITVQDCRRGDPTGSDHAPLIVDLLLK